MPSSDDDNTNDIETRIARFKGLNPFAGLRSMRASFVLHLVTEKQHELASDAVLAILEKYHVTIPDSQVLFNAYAEIMRFSLLLSLSESELEKANITKDKLQ